MGQENRAEPQEKRVFHKYARLDVENGTYGSWIEGHGLRIVPADAAASPLLEQLLNSCIRIEAISTLEQGEVLFTAEQATTTKG